MKADARPYYFNLVGKHDKRWPTQPGDINAEIVLRYGRGHFYPCSERTPDPHLTSWGCSLSPGHTGDHEAYLEDIGLLVARWPGKEFIITEDPDLFEEQPA